MDATEYLKAHSNLSEHLVTLAIALLTLSITFLDKLKANLKTKKEYNLLIGIWVLLTVSIFLGLTSSYLSLDTALICANPNSGCEVSPLMKYCLLINLVIFSSTFILIATIGYKALSNSKSEILSPTINNSVTEEVIQPKPIEPEAKKEDS